MAISKVVYKSSANATPVTWMDATPATAAAADIIAPKTAMLADGVMTEGTGSGGTTPTIESLSVTPSTSQQTFNAAGVDGYKPVVVAAMPSGTAGTPTATKGTVSNHSVTITPSVTNTTGYITGGAKTGTAVTVQASELVSGTLTVDSSGTKDVTNYASASVPAMTLPSASSGSPTGASKATIARSTSAQYINIPTGFNNTAQYYTVSAVPNGTEGTPTVSRGAVSNHSVTVTPSVTNSAGYIYGGTKTGTAVTVSASELVSGSETKTANGTYDVTNLASLVVAIPIVHYYTSSQAPTSADGANGDIWLQTS